MFPRLKSCEVGQKAVVHSSLVEGPMSKVDSQTKFEKATDEFNAIQRGRAVSGICWLILTFRYV
jgi:hypothetical protein